MTHQGYWGPLKIFVNTNFRKWNVTKQKIMRSQQYSAIIWETGPFTCSRLLIVTHQGYWGPLKIFVSTNFRKWNVTKQKITRSKQYPAISAVSFLPNCSKGIQPQSVKHKLVYSIITGLLNWSLFCFKEEMKKGEVKVKRRRRKRRRTQVCKNKQEN